MDRSLDKFHNKLCNLYLDDYLDRENLYYATDEEIEKIKNSREFFRYAVGEDIEHFLRGKRR